MGVDWEGIGSRGGEEEGEGNGDGGKGEGEVWEGV